MHCAVRVRIDIGSVVGVAKPIAVNALVIPEGEGPVKTNFCVVWFVLRAFLSWLGASK